MSFALDEQLQQDCHVIGRLPLSHVLLMNNQALPWLILVPEVTATELIDLDAADSAQLARETQLLARLVRSGLPGCPAVDKLNIAAIGNIVRQLHIHIVGRYAGDCCWPGVVWGAPVTDRWHKEQVHAIRNYLLAKLPGFSA